MSELRSSLLEGLTAGFIDRSKSIDSEYKPALVLNDPPRTKVLSKIQKELATCKYFEFSVAFITMGGLASILNSLKEATIDRGIKGKILTTDYLNFTEPAALKALESFPNIEVRLYESAKHGKFHTKGYIFYKDDRRECADVIVGSANLTQAALSVTREWNIQLSALSSGDLLKSIQEEFDAAWESASQYSHAVYLMYSRIYDAFHDNSNYVPLNSYETDKQIAEPLSRKVQPNSMQVEALSSLHDLRLKGETKALVISATGTGKTYLCAFDVQQFNPEKCLFIVHRETILKSAMDSFKTIMGEDETYGFFKSDVKEKSSRFVFAMVQTLSKRSNLEFFDPSEFDYIVIDEAHHIQNEDETTYRKILSYFKPKFLLGLTATPERTDSYNIYKDFDNNIAYEIRLNQALEMNLLCPFHYFGVADITIDGKPIDDNTSINNLVNNERIRLIDEKLRFYSMQRDDIRGLIFCSRVEEAEYLSSELKKLNYRIESLSGKNNESERNYTIKRLEQPKELPDSLDYIITVDIFNEGVDIPSVNQIVMLRPTQSVIVYIQQLGRGLRLCNGKDYLTVIDFIGNYKNNFLIPVALFGDRSYRRGTIEKLMINGTPLIKGVSTIDFDMVAKERIYAAINATRYSDKAFLKAEYQNVKNRIGHIPSMMDFINANSISPLIMIGKYKNYPSFLNRFEKDYIWDEKDQKNASLSFLSSVLAPGIRPYEGIILKKLIENGQTTIYETIETTESTYGFSPQKSSIDSAIRILSNGFFDTTFKKQSGNICYCNISGDTICISQIFSKMLSDSEYRKQVYDILAVGESEYVNHYLEKRREYDFALYEKYTRQDVCRLLNWEKDEHGTVNGYKVDTKTRTCPIFVTYNKDSDNINDSIDYSDRFQNQRVFLWQSRTGKKNDACKLLIDEWNEKITEEIRQMVGETDLGKVKLPLFITKDKKIDKGNKSGSEYNFVIPANGATYHYYVGDVSLVSYEKGERAGKHIYNAVFLMEEPVSDEMFSYFESLKVLKELQEENNNISAV